jgi:hypothetical protein
MVGDPYQALPVGHAGAMASAVRFATASVELDTVHRFSDPEYAALTLRLRNPRDRDDALIVAGELLARGHVHRARSTEEARGAMVEAYFEWHARGKRVALVSGTNSEADAINDAIQQRRVDEGELDATVLALGMGEQRILVGDTVQTRRNDPRTPRRVDAARHTRADDAGCSARGSGGDAARGASAGLDGDGDGSGCWGAECGERDWDVERSICGYSRTSAGTWGAVGSSHGRAPPLPPPKSGRSSCRLGRLP